MKENKLNILENKNTKDNLSVGVQLRVIPPPNTFENIDCMEMMKKCPPKHFDLAIVDPPYGIGIDKWDVKPSEEYFGQLFRISKRQIIWGGNYFNLPSTQGWLCWDKTFSDDMKGGKLTQGGVPRENMADFELAWTSFLTKPKFIRYTYIGNLSGFNDKLRVDYTQEKKIHKTQKPVDIYRNILMKWAKPTDLILDTHVGSGSSLIACIEGGFDYYGCEIDKDYYDAARRRIARAFRHYELNFNNESAV